MKAELYRIEGPWTGQLAILPRPRGGDWLRDEVQAWHDAGVDVVVSALEPEEVEELGLSDESDECHANGIEMVAFPIPDRGVPESVRAALALVRQLESRLNEGKTVAVHCRQGVGRSALLAASILALTGLAPATAFERIAVARRCPVPDTNEQRDWVNRFAREFATAATQK